MKKDTVVWVLIAVLFVGQAVLFTMNCTRSKYQRYHSKAWKQCSVNYTAPDCGLGFWLGTMLYRRVLTSTLCADRLLARCLRQYSQ